MREPCYKCKFEHNPIDREPCEYCSDEYMSSGDHPAFQWAKSPTRAERIRAMTDEELADFIARQRFSAVNQIADKLGIDVTKEFIVCRKNALDWLRQEAKG